MDVEAQKPPIRLSRNDARLLLVAPMPGIKPADISITVGGRSVKISGRQSGPGHDEKDLILEEWKIGPYYREVELPETVSGVLTNATFGNGILILAMPKAGKEMEETVTFQLEPIDAARGARIGQQGAVLRF